MSLWGDTHGAATNKPKFLPADEDLEPVNGSKTLTKKTQEKITINPMEKDYIKR